MLAAYYPRLSRYARLTDASLIARLVMIIYKHQRLLPYASLVEGREVNRGSLFNLYQKNIVLIYFGMMHDSISSNVS